MENNKIDFVIIWVDGNDKNWQKEKSKYSSNKNADSRNIRYRDWENLRYLFRGIEKYASWVNKIYFVTCGHYPEWLNKNNPKLVCVKHSDYMPKEYLPTFSSHPIELNLHRIPNLSEKFVYFNDDTFIVNNLKPTDFFRNGLPCDMAVMNPVTARDDIYVSVVNNVVSILNKDFNKKEIVKNNLNKYLNVKYGKYNLRTLLTLPWNRIMGFYETHNANAYLKSTYEDVWEKEYDILNETSTHKFRSSQDVNQYIFKYWQFCEGKFFPKKNIRKSYCIFDNIDAARKAIETSKYKLICLNDGNNNTEAEFIDAKNKILDSFEKKFPNKSKFEK